ncbi:hypothetical protein HMPREF1984_00951 [Leptotrichia sp. oral taxon 215 str. W9775]|nr:hypothetical protein HMPREF1984_00951 [Leptotrichia sp. oral taxon 215 str. W9775]
MSSKSYSKGFSFTIIILFIYCNFKWFLNTIIKSEKKLTVLLLCSFPSKS